MRPRSILLALLVFVWSSAAEAQVNQQDRFYILGTLIADNAAARVAMPFGNEGVRLSEDGVIDEARLVEELREEGQSIQKGQVVTITAIDFDDDKIEVELDGGGKNQKGILDRIQFDVGVGRTRTITKPEDTTEYTGSKIFLRFDDKAPRELSVDRLKEYLSPVLDFDEQNFMDSGIESLPEEFQEAVAAKEAKIGMDRSTVIAAIGRPHRRIRETTAAGVEQETWVYEKLGFGADFIYFEGDIVVKIVRYR